MATTPAPIPAPRRLLIVDDHPDLASTLARSIAQACRGLQVHASRGGGQALEQAGDLPVDVLITDLMMPEMNGLELIERLAARAAGAPRYIILITAYETAHYQDAARRLNVNEMILKPFPPSVLIQTVRRALDDMDRAEEELPSEIGEPMNPDSSLENSTGMERPSHRSDPNRRT